MRAIQQYEIDAANWWAERLRAHRWRVEHWQSIAHIWTPEGLTCPACNADHCEIDGHFCERAK
jgi:hypothetical protein